MIIRLIFLVGAMLPHPEAQADPEAPTPTVKVKAEVKEPTHPVCAMVESRIKQEFPKEARWRLASCSTMAYGAEKRNLDVPLTVELAWGESRFSPKAVNPHSGCSGILQAAPRWWCPDGKKEGCDLLKAGLWALESYLKKHKDEEKALCHFKSGNVCNPVGLRGSKDTMRRVHKLRRRIRRAKALVDSKDNT